QPELETCEVRRLNSKIPAQTLYEGEDAQNTAFSTIRAVIDLPDPLSDFQSPEFLAAEQTHAALNSTFQAVDGADWNRFWADIAEAQTLMTQFYQALEGPNVGDAAAAYRLQAYKGPDQDAGDALGAETNVIQSYIADNPDGPPSGQNPPLRGGVTHRH